MARADEGERLWSRIEEREKKYQQGEVAMCALRDENARLREECEQLRQRKPPEGKPPVSSSPKGLPLRTESEELQVRAQSS